MMKDALKSRGQALEDSFFRSVDQALIEIMREQSVSGEARKKLSESTGITNEQLLDELLDSGITHATIVSFLLLPLAMVAWADGQVDEEERTVTINTAIALGYSHDSVGIQLLKSWLGQQPDEKLFSIWREYANQLTGHLKQSSRQSLAETIVERSKAVAKATGGFLGIHKMSKAEHQVVQQIENAFKLS